MRPPKVLVTGGTGFIGRHLITTLVEHGWPTVALIRSADRAVGLPSGPITAVGMDEEPEVARVIQSHRPDAIVHLATHFVARHAEVDDVRSMITANVAFGAELADAASRNRVPVVSASSVWQHYGGAAYDPVSLYAATKQAFDDILTYFSEVESLGWTRLILGDTYGTGDTRGKLLSHLLDAALTGKTVEASSGRHLWEALNVHDVVAALLGAVKEQVQTPGTRAYQLRPSSSPTVRDVVRIAESAIEREIRVNWDSRPDRGREMLTPWIVADPPTWWRPTVDLREGIREVWLEDFVPRTRQHPE